MGTYFVLAQFYGSVQKGVGVSLGAYGTSNTLKAVLPGIYQQLS